MLTKKWDSECGNNGKPTGVHVDQEFDYKKTLVTNDFESFVKSLISGEAFE
jgi:hypothetical protein